MTEPKGSVTITQQEMFNCVNHWQILHIMRSQGVPFGAGALLTPHPDYEYTEHVDYDNHSITVTWSYLGDASDLGELEL